LPNNSSIQHQFSRHAKEYFSHSYNSNPKLSHNASLKRQEGHSSVYDSRTNSSPLRVEQKFQSSGSRKQIDETFAETN
jgi:hypothetical protein